MTVGRKIAAVCAGLIALGVVQGGAALYSALTVKKDVVILDQKSLPGMHYMGSIINDISDLHKDMWKHITLVNLNEIKAVENDMAGVKQRIKEDLDAFEKVASKDAERRLVGEIRDSFHKFLTAWEGVQEYSRKGQNKKALDAYKKSVYPVFTLLSKQGYESVVALKNDGQDAAQRVAASSNLSQALALVCLSFSLLGGSAAAFFLIRSTNRSLRAVVAELNSSADQVSSAASAVSESGQSLAQGASQQAASLEQTSTSCQEVTSMTQRNSDNAKSAAFNMNQVDKCVGTANRTLGEMVTAMSEITAASDKISHIIKVIDEIAFQTNILALNAAVEAARAGEAGMGFAVVAGEVRNLAQRSAQAAKDTASMIEESIAKSGEGSRKLHEVNSSIQEITDSATNVKKLVDEVNLSSQEQARGIDQISQAILQMEQVTHNNAASAEESASASHELSAQAGALRTIVAKLRVMVDGGRSVNDSHPKRRPAPPMTSSLATLHSALGPTKPPVTRKPAPSMARVSFNTAQDSIPLDDDFKDF
ncbi:MAG: hypothetical protein FJW20_07525 [Acidimicrobiia bacterium]|nr:hypothetical protein [Acidimicrobiia bacterium]